MATCLVTGNMIGSGIFFLPTNLAPYGWIAIAAWVVTGLGALMLALVFGGLARAVPATGGPYVFTRYAFGPFAGFLVAWGYWLTVVVSNAAVAVATVGFTAYFVPELEDGSWAAVAAGLAFMWVLTAINARGVESSGKVVVITTVIKLIPLGLIATLGLFWGDFGAIEANPSGDPPFSALSSAAALTLFAFIGLESATVPAGDVRDPTRTIPRATVVGTTIAMIVYLLGTLAVFGVLAPSELATSTSPFGDAAEAMWGGWAGTFVAVGAVVSALGTLNGFILLQGQMPMAAAEDGLFPKQFAGRNERGVPMVGLVASSALASGAIVLANTSDDGFEYLLLLTTVTALVPYLFSAGAQLVFLKTMPEKFHRASFAKDATIGGLALGYSLWTIYGGGEEAVFWSFLALMAGVPVFVLVRWQQVRDGVSIDVAGSDTTAGRPPGVA